MAAGNCQQLGGRGGGGREGWSDLPRYHCKVCRHRSQPFALLCLPSSLQDSFLSEGFILDKKIGVGQPKRLENANVLIANTPMDTDKIKIYGARVRVDSMAKVSWGGGGVRRGGDNASGF